MRIDPRPPVVYLRSFAADDKEGASPLVKRRDAGGKVGISFQTRWSFYCTWQAQEKFPMLGAARTYVDGDCVEKAAHLISRACLVVVRAGDGAGLLRELQYVT